MLTEFVGYFSKGGPYVFLVADAKREYDAVASQK